MCLASEETLNLNLLTSEVLFTTVYKSHILNVTVKRLKTRFPGFGQLFPTSGSRRHKTPACGRKTNYP